jgi:hypothetical protein
LLQPLEVLEVEAPLRLVQHTQLPEVRALRAREILVAMAMTGMEHSKVPVVVVVLGLLARQQADQCSSLETVALVYQTPSLEHRLHMPVEVVAEIEVQVSRGLAVPAEVALVATPLLALTELLRSAAAVVVETDSVVQVVLEL